MNKYLVLSLITLGLSLQMTIDAAQGFGSFVRRNRENYDSDIQISNKAQLLNDLYGQFSAIAKKGELRISENSSTLGNNLGYFKNDGEGYWYISKTGTPTIDATSGFPLDIKNLIDRLKVRAAASQGQLVVTQADLENSNFEKVAEFRTQDCLPGACSIYKIYVHWKW